MLRYLPASLLLLCGAVILFLPIHMVMTGVILLLLGGAVMFYELFRNTSDKKICFLRMFIAASAAAAVILLIICMSLITAGENGSYYEAMTSDYAIVLGAAVKSDGTASQILTDRLTAAMDFMECNPTAKVVLSGGQGSDESVTEAYCMYQALVSMGAEPERLLIEDGSHTTLENLRNCKMLINRAGGTDAPVSLITSEFHIRRALYLSEKLGIDACGWPSDTDQWFFRVNYTLREVFAMLKAMLQTAEYS